MDLAHQDHAIKATGSRTCRRTQRTSQYIGKILYICTDCRFLRPNRPGPAQPMVIRTALARNKNYDWNNNTALARNNNYDWNNNTAATTVMSGEYGQAAAVDMPGVRRLTIGRRREMQGPCATRGQDRVAWAQPARAGAAARAAPYSAHVDRPARVECGARTLGLVSAAQAFTNCGPAYSGAGGHGAE